MDMSNVSRMLPDELSQMLPDREDLLKAVGLQFRRAAADSLIATLGAFTLGAVVGAGVALLYAPRSGREMREELGARFGDVRDRVNERFAQSTQE